jgi:hypothetical protein
MMRTDTGLGDRCDVFLCDVSVAYKQVGPRRDPVSVTAFVIAIRSAMVAGIVIGLERQYW